MENNKVSDINSVLHKLKSSGIKLPRTVHPSVDSLIFHLDKLRSVSDKQKFERTASFVCRVLDSATFSCLNNDYKQAVANGDHHLARVCHNQLIDFNRRRNRPRSSPPDNRNSIYIPAPSSVNLPAAGSVKKFHYAESLLNDSDFKPVRNLAVVNNVTKLLNETNINSNLNSNKSRLETIPFEKVDKTITNVKQSTVRQDYNQTNGNNFVFNDRQAIINNTIKPRQWNFVTKLLNETYRSSDLNCNKSRLETYPFEKVDKTIANDKKLSVRHDGNDNQTNLKRMRSDLSLHSFRPINDSNPSGVYRNSNVRSQSEVRTDLSRNYLPTLNYQYADRRPTVGNHLTGHNEVRSLKTDVSKSIVDNNTRNDEIGMSVPKNRILSRVATQVENKRTPARRYNTSPVQKKSSERILTLKSKNKSVANDSRDGSAIRKQPESRRKSKGTPRIVKKTIQNDSNKYDKKNITFDNVSTPVKRFSRLSKIMDSAKVARCKRKHQSACSSDLNSTLRPRAKRVRKITLTPSESKDKILSKKTKRERTVDSKVSCVNSLNYSAATTDMSSAYTETPKSTMTNRIGKVKVFYKRNLFSTPRDRAKKKWLK